MADLVQQLRDRIAELEEEIRQIRNDMLQDSNAFTRILSKQQSALLAAICKRPTANYAYLDNVTEHFGLYNRYEGEMHITLRTRVAVWKLRKKLKQYGIEVQILRGTGYYIDDENREKLKKLMEVKE